MQTPQPYGPWQILSRREVYRDPWIGVTRDEVIRPDGHPGSHCIVSLKPGISVLAIDDRGIAHLTEEFHYAVGRVTLEVVSGGIDEGEAPLATARRELQEELGITADEWIDMGTCDPITSVVTAPTWLYVARGLHFGATAQEGTEQIRRREVPFDEVIKMALDGRISHSPSVLVILKARLQLKL